VLFAVTEGSEYIYGEMMCYLQLQKVPNIYGEMLRGLRWIAR